MTVSAFCSCGFLLRAEDQYAGKKARCPKCGKGVRLPAESDEAAARSPSPSMNFATWQPVTAEAPPKPFASIGTESPASAEASQRDATPSTKTESSVDLAEVIELGSHQENVDFRQRFFGVFVCRMAFRIVGILWVGLTVTAAIGFLLLMLFSLIYIAVNDGFDATKRAVVVQLMTGLLFSGWCILSFVCACGLLAMSELLHAAGWWFYRQRIGGLGPF